MKIHLSITALVFSLFLIQCKTQDFNKSIDFGNASKVIFLDSIAASNSIITDKTDNFFERVTLTEMEIQMKSKKHYTNREECKSDYLNYLKTEVEDFNEEEISLISKVFREINMMLNKVNLNLIHQDIMLVKTKANHYGQSVYYTRENKIIIPNNEIENFNEQAFKDVILHELFHIISRYNPK